MKPEEAQRVILRPHVTEKTFELLERDNKLVFIVTQGASKGVIKQAVETLYDVRVRSVNTLREVRGKIAYVRLTEEYSAADVASKLGLV